MNLRRRLEGLEASLATDSADDDFVVPLSFKADAPTGRRIPLKDFERDVLAKAIKIYRLPDGSVSRYFDENGNEHFMVSIRRNPKRRR
jgi:hypothetical protein